MTKKYMGLLIAKGNLINGLLAVLIISAIVLGCTCNGKDVFEKDAKDDNSSESSEANKAAEDAEKDKEDEDTSFKADDEIIPTDAQAQNLAQTTLMRFNEAVLAGDFEDFHKTISSTWRKSSKPSDFNKGFKQFIDQKADISRIRGEKAEFDPKPNISRKRGAKVLSLQGKYDTKPLPVRFNLEYMVDDDEWKLFKIEVNTLD